MTTLRGCIFLEQLRARSYESEYPISVSAGVLLSEGYQARRARVRVDPRDERSADRRTPAAVVARLATFLRECPLSHVLIVRDHYPDLEERVRAILPEAEILTVQVREFPPLSALRRWLEGRSTPRALPTLGMLRHEVDELALALQQDPSRLSLACTDLSPEVAAEGFEGDLYLDQHCYYRAPYSESAYPALQGTLACSFCDIPQYAKRAVATDTAMLERQLERYAVERPSARTFHLFDAGVVGHVDAVAEAVERSASQPTEICIDIRVPEILRGRERIERALGRLESTGHVLDFYCVGFETFSEREFSRFNKGYPVVENVDCLLMFAELKRAFPRSFEYQRHSSHGFINFTPWSTIDDLLVNAYYARALGFSGATAEWYLRKLRIYDTLPIARLAEADRVFVDEYRDWRLDNAQWKLYRQERPWQFLDPATARVAHWTYRLLMPEADGERGVTERLRALLEPRAQLEWGTLAFAAILHTVEASDESESDADFIARVERLASGSEADLLPALRVLGLENDPIADASQWSESPETLELALVRAGLKPAAKLEPVSREVARTWEDRLRALGLEVLAVPRQRETNLARRAVGHRDDVPALAVARDVRAARELARAMEAAPHEEDASGVEAVGRSLGYPPCCVRAYLDRRSVAAVDTRLLALALADTEGAPEPYLDPWSPWRGIEYVPCSFSCAASIERAERALGAGLIARADDPLRLLPQLIVSSLSRIVLEGAEPIDGGFRYANSLLVGAADALSRVYLGALREGDSVAFTARLALVRRGGRLLHALPHDLLVPFEPGAPVRFSWLAESRARLAVATVAGPSATSPPVVRSSSIEWPPSPSATLSARLDAALRLAGPSIEEALDDRRHGYVILLEGGEHAFFTGGWNRSPRACEF